MDKFNELIRMLKEIISRIDEEIVRKEEEHSQIEDAISSNREERTKAEGNIHENERILNLLKHYDNKNILLTILKDLLHEIKDTYKKASTRAKVHSLVFSLLLLALIIGMPLIGGVIMLGFLTLLVGPVIATNIEEIIKAKKAYTLTEPQEEIENLKKQISELTKGEKFLYRKQEEIERSQSDLTKEKIMYTDDLAKVKQEQSAAIERLISPEVLNAEFNEQTLGDIIRRTREIQKKEGKNNGEII